MSIGAFRTQIQMNVLTVKDNYWPIAQFSWNTSVLEVVSKLTKKVQIVQSIIQFISVCPNEYQHIGGHCLLPKEKSDKNFTDASCNANPNLEPKEISSDHLSGLTIIAAMTTSMVMNGQVLAKVVSESNWVCWNTVEQDMVYCDEGYYYCNEPCKYLHIF